MTEHVTINVYLIPINEDQPAASGNIFFVFTPGKPFPSGASLAQNGDLDIGSIGPTDLAIKYVLKTKSLTMANNDYEISFKFPNGESAKHMLWISPNADKPKVEWAAATKFKNFDIDNSGGAKNMKFVIEKGSLDSGWYAYDLAVNMTDKTGSTIVRNDPQIKNGSPGIQINAEVIQAAMVGILIGALGALLVSRLRNRNRQSVV